MHINNTYYIKCIIFAINIYNMKTHVLMKRELFGCEISQQSKTEFFSATELVKAGNKWRRENDLTDFNLAQFLKGNSFNEFKSELESKYGAVISTSRGRNASTWVHPILFIDIALAINPKLKNRGLRMVI